MMTRGTTIPLPEPSDLLAYRLYEAHQRIMNLKTKWTDLNSGDKQHWRALAGVAIEFCAGLADEEETIG